MKRRAKAETAGRKVRLEAVVGRHGGRGIFAIEEAAAEMARRTQ